VSSLNGLVQRKIDKAWKLEVAGGGGEPWELNMMRTGDGETQGVTEAGGRFTEFTYVRDSQVSRRH